MKEPKLHDCHKYIGAVIVDCSSPSLIKSIVKGFLYEKSYDNVWLLVESDGYYKGNYDHFFKDDRFIMVGPSNLYLNELRFSNIKKLYMTNCPLKKKFINEKS